jgi:hypothetical protein
LRTITVGQRPISIEALAEPMDQVFSQLHKAYFLNERFCPLSKVPRQAPWYQEFSAAALQFFDNNAPSVESYFINFTALWKMMLYTGRLQHADILWQTALEPALEWERQHDGKRIHKGTPYYFWAMTALLRGDTDRGFLLAHQALDEDQRSTGKKTPDLPAYALVSLNFTKDEQAFKHWVEEQADYFDAFIRNYAITYKRTFTILDVKRRFFEAPPNIDAVFLLVYTIVRCRKIAELPGPVTGNSFAGQLQINLLFDITLVIDAAIKVKEPALYFSALANHLLAKTGHPTWTPEQLGKINKQFKDNFEKAVEAAIDGTLIANNAIQLDRLQCDVALAYGIRNRGAHEIATSSVIRNRFREIQEVLFRVLCVAIEYLY